MKKIIIAVSLVLISFSNYSQSGAPISFNGLHDSLLFDGAGETSAVETGKDCLMKVLLANGNVTGTVVKKEIDNICGKIDTIILYEKRLIKEGDMVVAGKPISTEKDNDFVIVQLSTGENMFLTGERGLIEVKDYCKNPPNVYITLGAGKLGIDWNPLLPKTLIICSENVCLRIKGTVFSLEIVKEGDLVTNILKIYEGAVTFGKNMESEANKKIAKNNVEEMKKLAEDYKNGKISIEEFSKKMQEIKDRPNESMTGDEITVNEGFESRITGTDKPTDPVPIEANEKPWWETK
ncbi:MAG TPA: hypothetical protein VGK25_04960 [Ignavibacteria bacterium]|jgi:hypothetical protein